MMLITMGVGGNHFDQSSTVLMAVAFDAMTLMFHHSIMLKLTSMSRAALLRPNWP